MADKGAALATGQSRSGKAPRPARSEPPPQSGNQPFMTWSVIAVGDRAECRIM